MLTREQLDALRWIDRFPVSCSRWMRGNKTAWDNPDLWDALELSGKRGAIRIPVSDWEAIRDLVEVAPMGGPSPWKLSDAGRAVLAQEADDERTDV